MFIPIESLNLFVYLAYKQLIIPFKYILDNNPSIQDNFPNQILLSEHKWVNDCDVSLEVDIDYNELISIGNGFHLLNNIIPISRIKKIWFQDRDQMIVTIGNIRISSAFVSQQLLKIDKTPEITHFDIDKIDIPNIPNINFTDEINLFDKYLGGLIILKNSFPEDYAFVRENINFAEKTNNKLLEFLDGDSELINIILNRQVHIDDVKNSAEKNNQPFNKFAGMVRIDLIDNKSPTYILAILHRYRRKLKDNFDGLLYEIDYLKTENIDRYKGLIFSYGIMLGYSKLSLELYFKNKKICNRFQFEDKDDYKTLEVVYKKISKKYIPLKISLRERARLLMKYLDDKISLSVLSKKFNVSERTIKKDIKKLILQSNRDFFEKVALFKKFKIRMNKNLFNEKLGEIIKQTTLSLQKLSKKLGISEKTLKGKIRQIVDNLKFSNFYKMKLLKKFNIIILKRMRVLKLEKILQNSKFTSKELAQKLQVSINTVRNYLKEIGAIKNRVGRVINYSLAEINN